MQEFSKYLQNINRTKRCHSLYQHLGFQYIHPIQAPKIKTPIKT